jgi:hypothetical protein
MIQNVVHDFFIRDLIVSDCSDHQEVQGVRTRKEEGNVPILWILGIILGIPVDHNMIILSIFILLFILLPLARVAVRSLGNDSFGTITCSPISFILPFLPTKSGWVVFFRSIFLG